MRSASLLDRVNSNFLLSSNSNICYLESSTQINGIGGGFFSVNICFNLDSSDITPVFLDSTNLTNGIIISYSVVLNAFLIGNLATVFTLPFQLQEGISYITINYNSSNQNATLFINDIEVLTQNVGVVSVSTGFKLMNSQVSSLNNNCVGGVKDVIIIDRQQTSEEISYFYESGIIDESTHEDCVFHFTSQIAYSDTINYMNDVVEIYNYAKPSINLVNVKLDLQGWTNDELGITALTSTFVAYRDYESKLLGDNFSGGGDSIIYKVTELRKFGINFDSSLSQYIEVENFIPSKEDGYTCLAAFKGNTSTPDNAFKSVFTKTDGVTGQYRFSIETLANTSNLAIVPTTASSKTVINNASYDNVNYVSVNTDINRNIRDQQWVSEQFFKATLNTSKKFYERSNVPLVPPELQGFDEMTAGTPMAAIGRYGAFSIRYYNGTIMFLQIWKGVLNDKEIKEVFNKGLFSNPSQKLLDKYDLVLYPDFNNPFDDAGTLKFNDLSPSNHTLIARNWPDLPTLEASKREI